jgi:hypothetical protein
MNLSNKKQLLSIFKKELSILEQNEERRMKKAA